MYKLIACDLDDTLLRNDFTISEINLKAIKEVMKKDIKFIVITGRMTASARQFTELIDSQLPFGSFQGAEITDPLTNETLYSCELEREKIINIIKYAEENNIHVNLYGNETIYVNNINKWSDYYRSFAREIDIKAVGCLQKFEFKSTPKMILIGERHILKKAVIDIEANNQINKEEINMFFSKANFLEFTNKNANKGFALKFLAEKWNIARKDIIAIGDNFNDKSMIEYAGLGICMGNGEEKIKQIADFVTLSNEDDGVAYAIKKFILDK